METRFLLRMVDAVDPYGGRHDQADVDAWLTVLASADWAEVKRAFGSYYRREVTRTTPAGLLAEIRRNRTHDALFGAGSQIEQWVTWQPEGARLS
jgi:hypothetical protein